MGQGDRSELTESEKIDFTIAIVEQGLERILEEFEKNLENLMPMQLALELVIVSEQLISLGRICELESFIQLCKSIQIQTTIADETTLDFLSHQALSLWKQCHSLISQGSLDELPCQLEGFELPEKSDFAFNKEVIKLQQKVFDAVSYLDDVALCEGISDDDLVAISEQITVVDVPA
jgi:chemosensory pili system protein ChpA (sensor histidine kinase/response regulator)